MGASFYFYDLETSGINARNARIMQFGGQRTDMNLKPVGEPDNILVRLPDDILPEPDAIMITGITPQATLADGITEAEFLKYFWIQIAVPDTIFIGYNNVRFDDEFIRFLHYRNFYDAYEWSWKDNRSRWDLLDVIRMTRALRPDGIEWPLAPDGRPSNRLELLTEANGLEHLDAHDALSDVRATIAIARMIRNKQPKLFEFLLEHRDKNKIKALASAGQPFVYSSGKYPSVYQKTTVVTTLGDHPGKQGVLVYDLRQDPEELSAMSPAELALRWKERVEDETKRFPVKTMQFNRCPAVAPLGVLDAASQKRLQIDLNTIQKNFKKLQAYPKLFQQLLAAIKIMDKLQQAKYANDRHDVDTQLYDGFFNDHDRTAMSVARAADVSDLSSIDFSDQRLVELLPLYKARNFPNVLTVDERSAWESYRTEKLLGGGETCEAQRFFAKLSEIAARPGLTPEQEYLLTELQLYGEAILPAPEF